MGRVCVCVSGSMWKPRSWQQREVLFVWMPGVQGVIEWWRRGAVEWRAVPGQAGVPCC